MLLCYICDCICICVVMLMFMLVPVVFIVNKRCLIKIIGFLLKLLNILWVRLKTFHWNRFQINSDADNDADAHLECS